MHPTGGSLHVFKLFSTLEAGFVVERPVYQACPACKGAGEREKAISLREFANLLDRAISMKPDYAQLAKVKTVSQYQDSRELAGI